MNATQRIRRARKREPEEQGRFLARMIRSAARRAAAEDPGRGLAMLLEVQALVDAMVDATGCQLVDQAGSAQVAAELGWTKQRVNGRWGPSAKARQATMGQGTTALAAAIPLAAAHVIEEAA